VVLFDVPVFGLENFMAEQGLRPQALYHYSKSRQMFNGQWITDLTTLFIQVFANNLLDGGHTPLGQHGIAPRVLRERQLLCCTKTADLPASTEGVVEQMTRCHVVLRGIDAYYTPPIEMRYTLLSLGATFVWGLRHGTGVRLSGRQ